MLYNHVDGVACIVGINGEGERKQERGRKMGVWGLGIPFFLPCSRSPSPSLFPPAMQAIDCTIVCISISNERMPGLILI